MTAADFNYAIFAVLAWVGHACIWTATLNYLYGCPIPKWLLQPYRLFCGLVIVGFPLLVWAAFTTDMPRPLHWYLRICDCSACSSFQSSP